MARLVASAGLALGLATACAGSGDFDEPALRRHLARTHPDALSIEVDVLVANVRAVCERDATSILVAIAVDIHWHGSAAALREQLAIACPSELPAARR